MPLDNDPIVKQLRADGTPVTRENYIEMSWPEVPDPWLPEHEALLPAELQDWSQFGQQPVA
jgi:hypothetical protein